MSGEGVKASETRCLHTGNLSINELSIGDRSEPIFQLFLYSLFTQLFFNYFQNFFNFSSQKQFRARRKNFSPSRFKNSPSQKIFSPSRISRWKKKQGDRTPFIFMFRLKDIHWSHGILLLGDAPLLHDLLQLRQLGYTWNQIIAYLLQDHPPNLAKLTLLCVISNKNISTLCVISNKSIIFGRKYQRKV